MTTNEQYKARFAARLDAKVAAVNKANAEANRRQREQPITARSTTLVSINPAPRVFGAGPMPTTNTTKAGARTHIEWNKISDFEMSLIDKIVKRAAALYQKVGIADDPLTITMDLAGAHIVCPIALDELLFVDDSTFNHDVLGIRRHFNRRTFNLEDCFVPRTAIQ